MDYCQRELLVYSICSDTKRYDNIVLKSPNLDAKLRAAEIYKEAFDEAQLIGVYTEEENLEMMFSNGLWSLAEQEELDNLPKQIEDVKVDMYNLLFKSIERGIKRQKLGILNNRYDELYRKRHAYDHTTCAGVASLAKLQYLISSMICNTDIYIDDYLVQKLIGFVSNFKPSEPEYRELARTEPWSSIWNNSKEGNPFGKPSITWTEEQSVLCSWSRLYDNVYQHHESPHHDIIQDDDLLDGWLIIQRRKREEDADKKLGEDKLTNEKIRNSEEIFLVADTIADAKKIDNINDVVGKAIKKQRFNVIKQRGTVEQADLPDVRQDIQMQLNNLRRRNG